MTIDRSLTLRLWLMVALVAIGACRSLSRRAVCVPSCASSTCGGTVTASPATLEFHVIRGDQKQQAFTVALDLLKCCNDLLVAPPKPDDRGFRFDSTDCAGWNDSIWTIDKRFVTEAEVATGAMRNITFKGSANDEANFCFWLHERQSGLPIRCGFPACTQKTSCSERSGVKLKAFVYDQTDLFLAGPAEALFTPPTGPVSSTTVVIKLTLKAGTGSGAEEEIDLDAPTISALDGGTLPNGYAISNDLSSIKLKPGESTAISVCVRPIMGRPTPDGTNWVHPPFRIRVTGTRLRTQTVAQVDKVIRIVNPSLAVLTNP